MQRTLKKMRGTLGSLRVLAVALTTTILAVAACADHGQAETSPYTPPATVASDDGSLSYTDAPTIDRGTAAGVWPGQASPEAAVTHFFASRIRGDRRHREVLVPQPSERFESALDSYDEWTFRAFRLVGKRETGPDTFWIKVWFEVEIDGDIDEGTDDVGVRRTGDGWRIESVPQ